MLKKCGFDEAVEKASPPSKVMSFLGVLFNTETMTMGITPERLSEIRHLIKSWLTKETATMKQLQCLLGKLNFVAACVKPEIKMKRLESPPSGRFMFVARVPVAPPTIRHIVSKSKPVL